MRLLSILVPLSLAAFCLWSGAGSLLRARHIAELEVAGHDGYRSAHPGWRGWLVAELRYPNHRWMRQRQAVWQVRLTGALFTAIGVGLLLAAITTAQAAHILL